jgi:hypothetical protein
MIHDAPRQGSRPIWACRRQFVTVSLRRYLGRPASPSARGRRVVMRAPQGPPPADDARPWCGPTRRYGVVNEATAGSGHRTRPLTPTTIRPGSQVRRGTFHVATCRYRAWPRGRAGALCPPLAPTEAADLLLGAGEVRWFGSFARPCRRPGVHGGAGAARRRRSQPVTGWPKRTFQRLPILTNIDACGSLGCGKMHR